MASYRKDAGVSLWSPWRHIGRLAGELTIGRVCFDLYTDQPVRRAPFVTVLDADPVHPDRHMHFKTYAFSLPKILLMIRRWR